MSILTKAVSVIAACVLSGCMFRVISEADLIGKYTASLPDGGVEELELLKGGRCIQVIRLRNGSVYEAHGNWELWRYRSRPRLTFKGLRSSMTATHEINPDIATARLGVIDTDVSRSFTGIPIINLTEDSYYRKVR